jgi:hypothetical protein
MKKLCFLIIILLYPLVSSDAQTAEQPSSWDNQLHVGNKIAAGKDDWRYSGEFQVRLKDNTQSLDNYFIEDIATYLLSK